LVLLFDAIADVVYRTDPDSSRVREMLQGYECHEFGPDIELFSDIVVYVRKSVAAPVAGEDGRFPFT
jgi:hypothetical protein